MLGLNTHVKSKIEFFTPSLRILIALSKGKKSYHELFAEARVSWSTFVRLLKNMSEEGYIKSIGDGVYELTEKGRSVLLEIKREFEVVN